MTKSRFLSRYSLLSECFLRNKTMFPRDLKGVESFVVKFVLVGKTDRKNAFKSFVLVASSVALISPCSTRDLKFQVQISLHVIKIIFQVFLHKFLLKTNLLFKCYLFNFSEECVVFSFILSITRTSNWFQ